MSAWQSYLTQRGWISETAFELADKQTQLAGLAVLSAALSFPLTIAKSWAALKLPPPGDSGWRLCVVGARAEASLPPHVWAELSLLTGARKLAIEFSGPSAAPKGLSAERDWVGPDGQRLRLSLGSADLFHRSSLGQALLERSRTQHGAAAEPAAKPAAEPAPSNESTDVEAALPNAFVLFNPGLGEPGWERAWAPTMRALLASRRPLLMTALSHSDAARDVSFLEQQLKWGSSGAAACIREAFADNAFASLLSAGGDGLADGLADGASTGAAAAAQAGGSGGAANSCVRILGDTFS